MELNVDQIKVELQETMGSDRAIANAAWTSSFEKDKREARTDQQVSDIVKRLARDGHSTPFESVVFRFWIKMPISSDRQHMTHRIASHNGMSGRYRTMPTEYFDMPDDVMDIANKIGYKNQIEILDKLGNSKGTSFNRDFDSIYEAYIQACETANHAYSHMVELAREAEREQRIDNNEFKRFREFVRGVLPQNNMTERVTIFNLRSFANYQKLRNSAHAAPEIREIAKQMLEAVRAANVCPAAICALENNGWKI